MTAEENTAVPEDEATKAEEGGGPESSDEKSNATTESEDTVAEPDGTDTEATDEDETTGEGAEQDAETAPADGAPKKRRAGKAWAVVAMIAALMFVGSAAFAGAMMQPYLADRAIAATKLNVARTAANAITTLWTYTPENMDTLADRASRYLSGDFEAQYRKFVDAIVAPNKQAKITNSTEVTGAAVETFDGPNAAVIVYTNTTSTSPLTKNVPSLKYLSYRLFLKRSENRWLVTRMTTITSLDLTPKV